MATPQDTREELELKKIQQEINQSRQHVDESIARTQKMLKENQYYPLVIGSGLTLAIVAVVKLFL
ncbi:MAG: hypothetical protein AAF903_03425 [Pseudomonadota bacterium]